MVPSELRWLGCTLFVTLLGCLVGLTGCSGSRFGSELSERPKPRPVGDAAGETLRLPQDEPFSIALPTASEEAGLDGTAEADADASGAGSAEAVATVTNSGKALGLFRLGHAVENDSDRQADIDFVVRFHYAFDAAATPESAYPDARIGLKLYARGGRGRLLRDLTLLTHSTESGAASRESDETLRFTLTLGPGESASVFLAGQVEIEIRAGRSAHGSLKLTDLRMEATSRPAPAVQSTGDEQG